MNNIIKKYATEISKISGITTIGDIEIQLHHLLAETDIVATIEYKLSREFEWDNWKNENDEYWTVPQVLYCKLEWLEEYLNDFIDEDSEHLDTIDQVKKLLNILSNEGVD